VYACKSRKEKFYGRGGYQRNVTDLAGSLVTSCRPPGRLQKRPDDRTWNAGVAARTADGSRRTADAADEQCLRCGCSSPSCTVVLCAADIDGPLHTVALHPLRNVQPVQLVVQEMTESAVVLTTRAYSREYSLELVCGGLGCPSVNSVAVVHVWRHKSVDQRSR